MTAQQDSKPEKSSAEAGLPKTTSNDANLLKTTSADAALPKTTSAESLAQEGALARNREFIRAESEDDDGYDPYSDRVAYTPLFERDPWA